MIRSEMNERPPSIDEGGFFVMSGEGHPERFNSFGAN
jgi:hypothetical protein